MVIKIIYCGQWNYLPDALRAREILQKFDTIGVKLVESGGGIFDYLPISNNDNKMSYKKLIRNDHNETFQKITEAYGINYTKIENLSGFKLPKTKDSQVIELKVNKDSSLNFYNNLLS